MQGIDVSPNFEDLIKEALFYEDDPYSIARILYKLNHEKYSLVCFEKNRWISKTDTKIPSATIIKNLKEDVATIVRNYFVDFYELTEKKDDCMFYITNLENPKFIKKVIKEAKEMFYEKK